MEVGVALSVFQMHSYISIYKTNTHILWSICMYTCGERYSEDDVCSLIQPSLVGRVRCVLSCFRVLVHRKSVMMFFSLTSLFSAKKRKMIYGDFSCITAYRPEEARITVKV